jgi:hypothetical protein
MARGIQLWVPFCFEYLPGFPHAKKTQINTNASQRDGIVLSTCSYIIMYFMYPGVQKRVFLPPKP